MRVIAHRGANKEALENSWRAFELAIDAGASRIELDVQLTQDGHAIINHDDSLAQTTGKHIFISRSTRAELSKLKLLNGEPIPFLDEAVERLLDRTELNIEIKGPSEALAASVCKLVGNHALREKIVISSFCIEPLRWIAKNHNELTRACLWGWDTFSWPFFAHSAPQIFMYETDSRVIHPEAKLVSDNLMDQAEMRGWEVNAWVPMVGEEDDREGLWSILQTYGIDGLCTNYPRQLCEWLEETAAEHDHLFAQASDDADARV